jgi:hypothetical protein
MVIAQSEALERFPDARKAVAEATKQWKAAREAAQQEVA